MGLYSPGITIQNLTRKDISAASEIADLAFNRPGARKLRQRELERLLHLQPDGWWLALLNGRPAGLVGAVDYGPFAYVGMMSVHPDMRRMGVGRAVFRALLRQLDERNCPQLLLDATDLGAPLYEREGFVDDGLTRMYLLNNAAHFYWSPLDPAISVHPVTPADLERMAAFDLPYFGANRLRVLQSFWQEHPERCFLAQDARVGGISGWLIAQPRRIGPWVAAEPESADALLRAALRLEYAAAPAVLVSGCNQNASELLEKHGFRQHLALRHMLRAAGRPEKAHPMQRGSIYGLASFTLG